MKKILMSSVFAVIVIALSGCGDAGSTSSNNADQNFVNDMAMGNMTEIKLGELATTNGANKDVKDFGAQMVTDHGKANSELTALAAKKNWMVPAALDEKHQKMADKFSKLNGEKFDKEYVSDMVDDHKEDAKNVEDGLKKINDPDLKAWAQGMLQVVKSHSTRIEAYLYTLKVTDQAKADKINQSFPPGLKKEEI